MSGAQPPDWAQLRNWPLAPEFLERFANWSGLRTVVLTFDHDWAPDYMVAHCLDILAAHGAAATFFATGPCAALKERAPAAGHEIGAHINLAPGSTQGRDLDDIVSKLRAAWPEARGNRFHLLAHAYRDLMGLARLGFAYDVSSLRFNASHLLPAWHGDLGMTLLSYCWEDGFAVDGVLPVAPESLDLDSPGVKILNFHPVNIYLNCAAEDDRRRFQRAHPRLGETGEADARPFRRPGRGAETMLREALARIAARGARTATLGELVDAFRLARRATAA